MENKIKHLEFIQTVISRMNSNSFLLKGWCVTIVSALFALSAKDSETKFVIIAFFPIMVFWFLDGFYLSQERRFRDLYKQVAEKDPNSIDFSLETRISNRNSWFCTLFSRTILLFYGVISISVIVVMIVLDYF